LLRILVAQLEPSDFRFDRLRPRRRQQDRSAPSYFSFMALIGESGVQAALVCYRPQDLHLVARTDASLRFEDVGASFRLLVCFPLRFDNRLCYCFL
jgi:hypothetical protein